MLTYVCLLIGSMVAKQADDDLSLEVARERYPLLEVIWVDKRGWTSLHRM